MNWLSEQAGLPILTRESVDTAILKIGSALWVGRPSSMIEGPTVSTCYMAGTYPKLNGNFHPTFYYNGT